MTPREGGGGNFTHRVCSLLSAFCLHSQNYPRIRTLLWEDSNPGAIRGHAGARMRLLLIPGDALPPWEFPRGISERALRTEGDSSAVPGGGRSWKDFLQGLREMVLKGEGPWGLLCGREGPCSCKCRRPGGASAPETTRGSGGKQRIRLGVLL